MKNLRKYEKIFDAKDRERKQQLFAAAMVERRSLAEKFFSVMARRQVDVAQYRPARIALRDGYDSEDDSNYHVEYQLEETIVSTREQVIA